MQRLHSSRERLSRREGADAPFRNFPLIVAINRLSERNRIPDTGKQDHLRTDAL
jgi:hypothetical protein